MGFQSLNEWRSPGRTAPGKNLRPVRRLSRAAFPRSPGFEPRWPCHAKPLGLHRLCAGPPTL